GRLDQDVPVDEVGFLGAYERLRPDLCPPGADQPDPDEFVQVVRATAHDPVSLQDSVFGTGPNDATVVDERQIVADAVQIGGDVGGEQDAVSLVEEKVSDDADEFVAAGRVQAAGRLVE